ncbi:hypothetical protein EV421DRAFT_1740582 [Armillaria borealis]|uniref:Uncharacterized protein n=1 Tax=Armillaria borealis TaxID=47425 RepID=A0AA39J2J0_9AGAR|nr:hypothetical protein EV421DRAFT_1740582 [Armillaria borealis]
MIWPSLSCIDAVVSHLDGHKLALCPTQNLKLEDCRDVLTPHQESPKSGREVFARPGRRRILNVTGVTNLNFCPSASFLICLHSTKSIMDDHANEMEVIGGYSYFFADVKIMSARLNPPPHPLCPPVSLFAKWWPLNRNGSQIDNKSLSTRLRLYPRDPEDTLLKKEFSKIFPGLTEDPEYVTLADPFFEVALNSQQCFPVVMTTPGLG